MQRWVIRIYDAWYTARSTAAAAPNKATPGLSHDCVFAKEGVTNSGGGPGSQFHNEYVVFICEGTGLPSERDSLHAVGLAVIVL